MTQPPLQSLVLRALAAATILIALAGDAGHRHLAVHRPGEAVVGVGCQPCGEVVHLLAPGPERAGAHLGAPAQGTVECMAVCVGQPGQRQPGQADGVGGAGHTGSHLGDQPAVTTHEHMLRGGEGWPTEPVIINEEKR